MSENSKIQWTNHTLNPWIGCTKISPGCVNCYAENATPTRVARKNGRELWGKGQPRQRTSEANWRLPLKWNREAELAGIRARVFCASLADWLDDEVPAEWLTDLLTLIHKTPQLDWQLLTKRPENFRDRLMAARAAIRIDFHDITDRIDAWLSGDRVPHNVWLGTTCENQERADKRIPLLTSIPAKVRFLSIEPMLRPIKFPRLDGIHWAIFGGESGPGARPCAVEWIRLGINQCRLERVAIFVKQLGSNPNWSGQRCNLRDKKGGDMDEWPADLRVRQFPTEGGAK